MTPRIKALHSQTAVVSIIVKVNKGEDPKKTFTDKMGEALVFLREAGLDKDVAILHIDHLGGVLSSKRRIQKKLDVPKYIMDMRRFFYINAVNQPSGRSIKCSALMYFTSNPKKLLAEAGSRGQSQESRRWDLPQGTPGSRNSIRTCVIGRANVNTSRRCGDRVSSLQSHSRQSRKERTTRTMGSAYCDYQRLCSRDAVGIRQR